MRHAPTWSGPPAVRRSLKPIQWNPRSTSALQGGPAMLMCASRYVVIEEAPSPALDSQPLQCNQTGHWASGDCFRGRVQDLLLTDPFQVARTLLVRANLSARRVPGREVKLALVISAAKKVTGPMVRYSLAISCIMAPDQRVACPNPDGGTSGTKSRTTSRSTTSKRGARTTRSTSGSSTRGGKGTRGKKPANKFAAADDW